MYSGLVDGFADALTQVEPYIKQNTEEVFRNTKKLLMMKSSMMEIIRKSLYNAYFILYDPSKIRVKHGRISQITSIDFDDIQTHWKQFIEDERSVLFTTSPQSLGTLQHTFEMCEWKE